MTALQSTAQSILDEPQDFSVWNPAVCESVDMYCSTRNMLALHTWFEENDLDLVIEPNNPEFLGWTETDIIERIVV
jgi:hypothetical protein